MFWDRQSHNERIAAIHEIQETLRRHHSNGQRPVAHSAAVHPQDSFLVPEWGGADAFPGNAAAGRAPTWDL